MWNQRSTAWIIGGVVCVLILTVSFKENQQNTKPPNILFIVADDLGWNDVSWHNPDILTPNLHELAEQGVILNQSYVQPMCTPSRAAIMTGYYPFRIGLQNYVFRPLEPTGMPTTLTTLAQKLQSFDYKTYLVGKWHLGFCCWDYTPTWRGFQNFFGYYNGEETYYSHMTEKNSTPDNTYFGYDFRNDEELGFEYNGTYSTYLFTEHTIKVIKNQSQVNPFFIYLAFQAPHAPLEVPDNYSELYPNIENKARKTYSGMVSALDEGIGRIVQTLKSTGHYDNTIIIFTTDNGGQYLYGGNNWPLRGNKATIWEGGTRGVAFVHGTKLKKRGYVTNKLIHVVDWFPTLVTIAGGTPDPQLDGVDQWEMISNGGESARDEFVYNIDNTTAYSAAIRVGDFKLIVGEAGEPSGWIPPPDVMDATGQEDSIVAEWQIKPPITLPRLYNLKDDPTEKSDLAELDPDTAARLLSRLLDHQRLMVPSIHLPNDPSGNPTLWNGTFSPGWCTPIY